MLDSKQKVVIWLNQGHLDNSLPQPHPGATPNISNKCLTLNIINNRNIGYHGFTNDVMGKNRCDIINFKPSSGYQLDQVPIQPGNREPSGRKGDKVDRGQNGYNSLNHEIHQCLWCPCLLYFVFIFCLPAVYFMHKSDDSYHKSDTKKSRRYALTATLSYVIGFLLTIAFYAVLGWIVYCRL